jgi:hypothetical protein
VTDELNGQVWISPDLFETSVSGTDCNPRQSAKRPYRKLRDRERDSLKFRFILTIGFSNYVGEEFTVKPILVKPKRRRSFRKIGSDEICYESCRYDDGYDSNLDQSVG